MGLNTHFWARIFRSEYVPQIEALVAALEHRLLPTMKETDISHEAEAVADEFWEHLGSMPAHENADMGDFAEDARDAGVSHYMMLMGIRQGLINMFAVGLHHTLEQQLLQFHRREVLSPSEEHNDALFKIAVLKQRLKDRGVDLEKLSAWSKLDELRLVANAVKHAEGDSAEKLRSVRPDLFEAPSLRDLGLGGKLGRAPIFLPLVGEDLYVQEVDIRAYERAIKMFWEEFIASLERV